MKVVATLGVVQERCRGSCGSQPGRYTVPRLPVPLSAGDHRFRVLPIEAQAGTSKRSPHRTARVRSLPPMSLSSCPNHSQGPSIRRPHPPWILESKERSWTGGSDLRRGIPGQPEASSACSRLIDPDEALPRITGAWTGEIYCARASPVWPGRIRTSTPAASPVQRASIAANLIAACPCNIVADQMPRNDQLPSEPGMASIPSPMRSTALARSD